jgi:hypothetical protein
MLELGRFRLFLSMSIIDCFRLFSTISVSMSIFFYNRDFDFDYFLAELYLRFRGPRDVVIN